MRFVAKKKIIRNVIFLLLVCAVFVYFAMKTINRNDLPIESKTYPGTVMGTVMKKTIYSTDGSQLDEVNKLIDDKLLELEKQISVRDSNSEISMANRNYVVGGTTALSDNVVEYLRAEMQIYEETKGAFSPCIYPISSLWGIEDGYTEIPSEELIQQRVLCSDAKDIEIVDDGIIFNKSGMAIDLGAVGKGIACDLLKEELMQTKIQGTVVSIGGSILAYGDKGDGKEWHIGIQDPRGKTGDAMGVVDVDANTMISTSGDYEKYFELDGKRYHHIFNAVTGHPVENELISVTIVSDSGFLSDALSTACFVMGLEDGMKYAESKEVGAIFVTSDKMIYTTDNLKKKFHLKSKEYKIVKR